MSTFNTAQMQTDAMLAPVQMEAGRRRNEGIQYIGQAAAGAAQQFQEAQAQKQQLDIQDAEAAARISGWMQDQQVNQYKFEQMMALDQAMQSRYGTTMMGMQMEEQKLSLDQKKSALKGDELDQRAKAEALYLSLGMGVDEVTGKPVKLEQEELDKRIGLFQRMHFRQSEFSPDLEASRLERRWKAARERGDYETADALEKQIRALTVGSSAGGGASTGPSGGQPNPPAGQPAQGASRDALVQQVAKDPELAPIASNALHDEAWQKSPVWSKVGTDERTQVNMSAGIAAYSRHLLGLGKVGDPSMVHKFVMEAAETSPITMGQLLALTMDTDEEIRMKLEVLFPGREKSVYDSYMKQVQGFMDDLLKPRK